MSGSDLPARRRAAPPPAPATLAAGARTGALWTVFPALALAIPIPLLWQEIFWGPVKLLAPLLGFTLARNLVGAITWFLPALLALPVGALVARRVREEARHHPSRGRAVAAGACIGVTAACTLVIVVKNLVVFEPGWIGLQIMATALAVGVLGARTFAAAAPEGERGAIPPLYQALTTAGLTGPLFFSAAVLWGFLGLAFPGLSLGALLRASGLAAWIGSRSIASLLVVLPLLAPVTALSGRLARRLFPEASPGTLRAGLLLPAMVVLGYTTLPWLLTLDRTLTGTRMAGLLGAWVLGLGMHGVAARLAVPSLTGADPDHFPKEKLPPETLRLPEEE